MRIEVTAEDIRLGASNDMCRCPVALAIKRTWGLGVEVESDRVRVRGSDEEDWDGWIELPDEAQRFIDGFDHRKPVQPFEFELPT